ncbi:hypothetical protein OEG84_19775 [Hoeflea sp. G2-23]|uniref:Uncharacterized protein n=1 Tax=Hoeflea algicola TaxID=2983763 RepID=A0ABT3ZDJ8_9HYPH|nr:hypothetical protein [Hoeflea algicola]MCY0149877.1 hypothetical protein [Hoeflea algicola]
MTQPSDHPRLASDGAVLVHEPGKPDVPMDLEALVRDDYDRLRIDDSFEDLKHRARFSKEDRGLYEDWMSLAAQRAADRQLP